MGAVSDQMLEDMENEWYIELLNSVEELSGHDYKFVAELLEAGHRDYRRLHAKDCQRASDIYEELEQVREWQRQMDKDD